MRHCLCVVRGTRGQAEAGGSELSRSVACERESVEFDGDRAVCENGYVEDALVADPRAVRAGQGVMEVAVEVMVVS